MAGNGGGRARRPDPNALDTAGQSESAAMVADQPDAQRAGLSLAYRLAVGRYGRRAILRRTPAGPSGCPSGCPYCRRRSA